MVKDKLHSAQDCLCYFLTSVWNRWVRSSITTGWGISNMLMIPSYITPSWVKWVMLFHGAWRLWPGWGTIDISWPQVSWSGLASLYPGVLSSLVLDGVGLAWRSMQPAMGLVGAMRTFPLPFNYFLTGFNHPCYLLNFKFLTFIWWFYILIFYCTLFRVPFWGIWVVQKCEN